MLFNSGEFLVFFPFVVLCYYLIPQKFRYIWLFLCSYFFYMCWNVAYGLLLFGTTLVTYIGARMLEGAGEEPSGIKRKNRILAIVILLGIGTLGIFKYAQFAINTVQSVLGIAHVKIGLPVVSIVVPVGISFYLFQSVGYVIDVYRGTIKAEKNFILYATFISFFPQLVAGPIERANRLLPQFKEEHFFDYKAVKDSLLLMLWGFFIKLVIADRIAIFVNIVYDGYEAFDGWIVILATVLFAFQIYCDFAGYSIIAKGAAGVMGFELMDNFKAPYCASGIREFWARWHISLTQWFRDYIYIPLGGNRKGKLRKYLNTIIVFFVSGLWHGADWSYVLWGTLNGVYIVLEEVTGKGREKLAGFLRMKPTNVIRKLLGVVCTFILVDFSWIFFRASGIGNAVQIIKKMLSATDIHVLFDNTIHFMILERKNVWLMFLSILILIVVDVCHCKEIHFRELLAKQHMVIRWAFYWVFLMTILIFGVWGPNYSQSAFIYFQF